MNHHLKEFVTIFFVKYISKSGAVVVVIIQ